MTTPDPVLKTSQVAEALGVSVSTVKRWVDLGELEAKRTLGKHRLVRLSDAVRFARRHGLVVDALIELASRVSPAAALGLSGEGQGPEALAAALRDGDRERARAIILGAVAAGVEAPALADSLIEPAMQEVGHGWSTGAIDVYREHEATQAVTSALTELNVRLTGRLRLPAPVALGATAEGDPYSLALHLGELCLRELGWDVRNLGVSLPFRALAGAIVEHRPALVFVCVNYMERPEAFLHEFRHVERAAGPHGATVVVGGRAMNPGLLSQLNGVRHGRSLADLSATGRELATALKPPGGGDAPGPRSVTLNL